MKSYLMTYFLKTYWLIFLLTVIAAEAGDDEGENRIRDVEEGEGGGGGGGAGDEGCRGGSGRGEGDGCAGRRPGSGVDEYTSLNNMNNVLV